MKKTATALLAVILCLSLCACGAEEVDTTEPVMTFLPTEPAAEYGALQEIVDTYGFPIHLRMTEGMELTKIIIDEDSAEREWMSNDERILYDNLAWSISENQLTISGEWEDVFTINIESGRAVSQADGKEYHIVTYDEEGEVAFFVE